MSHVPSRNSECYILRSILKNSRFLRASLGGREYLENARRDETYRRPRVYHPRPPLTRSNLQFRHVVHIGGSLRLRSRIRGGRFVLQLAKSVLHRRQGIHNERERCGLTLRLFPAPSLALVQRQISHAVIGGAAVIVIGELLERSPGWNKEAASRLHRTRRRHRPRECTSYLRYFGSGKHDDASVKTNDVLNLACFPCSIQRFMPPSRSLFSSA